MKAALSILATLLLSSMLLAQAGPAAQDKQPADQSQPATVTATQVKALEDALAAQQKQIDEQRQQIEALREQLGQQGTPHVTDASLHPLGDSSSRAVVSDAAGPQEKPKESPLSVRIGNTEFTPGGFADFTAVFRTTNSNAAIGTGFNSIPFSNTVAGHLTENRFSAQNSRLTLKVHGLYGENDVTGYVEFDFLGNAPANLHVTSNSDTSRLRLYWVDLRRGKWEFLGGQSWSWLTPNRVGVSPMPGDIFFTNNMDTNYQVGLTWTRAAQFRVAYHFNPHWILGVALENPQQYTGPSGVTFPFAFNAQLGGQFDAGANIATPNLHPDIIAKLAYDTDFSGKHFHAEVAGVATTVKTTVIPTPGGTSFRSQSATGGGLSGAINLEFAKNVHLVANAFWSDGGGRYIFGLAPDAIVSISGTAPGPITAGPVLIHTASGIVGLEAQVTPKHMLTAYYGGEYAARSTFHDFSAPTLLLPVACWPGDALIAKPCAGYGYLGSPNSHNRAIQEGTIGWIYTFWSDKNYGKLQLITQWSYLTRAPWFVAPGAPKNAHAFMAWADVRYTLP
ncbi:MAG TPA: hypothetical protein VEG08_10310 [Terriglobales bacterium]|nr:hypothetical protein [Terriglobales bacterium]